MRSGKSSKSRKSGYSLPSSPHSTWAESSSNRPTGPMIGNLDRERDLERGPVSEPESEAEKVVLAETQARRSCWRRWRRVFMLAIIVLGLAGFAVGIIFGIRS